MTPPPPGAATGGTRQAGPCVVVTGPTATGKTALAVALARRFGGEILSADSRQVYRGLDLGTGKDLAEYGSGPDAVPYHLIDAVGPDESYHLFRFLGDAWEALAGIWSRRRLPIVAGGSVLYLHALLEGYRLDGGEPDPELRARLETLTDTELERVLADEAPELHRRTDRSQRRRLIRAVEIARTSPPPNADRRDWPRLRALLLAPYYPRAEVHRRIAARLDARLRAGLVDEVAALHRQGLSWERLEWLGLEYRYVSRRLRGAMSDTEMRDVLLARIRRFAKSQDVWFRKMERNGHVIHWIAGGDVEQAACCVHAYLAGDGAMPPPALRLEDIRYGPRDPGTGRTPRRS